MATVGVIREYLEALSILAEGGFLLTLKVDTKGVL